MKTPTNRFRRTQLSSGLLSVLLLSLAGCGGNAGEGGPASSEPVGDSPAETSGPEVPIRQNVSDFVNDPVLVAAFRQATETMRRNSSADPSTVEFRTSLTFWANTHGYFGTGGNATSFAATVARRLPQCLSFLTSSPYNFSTQEARETCEEYYEAASQEFSPDAFSDGIWGTCQHTTDATRTTPRFLPWHRLYLYYYERTLRKYAGNDAFALPYWDYFDYPANDPPNLWMPPFVTEGGSTTANTFYDALRTVWLNEQRTSMTPDNASAKDAFAESAFVDFSNTLEGVPHGAMHCATGNGCTAPHIGWVPVAGNDPLFYMHHANIDRLWQCWMNRKAGGEPIDLDWAKANLGMPEEWYQISYDFADENGNRVTKTIADAFSPEVLAVRYAEEVNCRIDGMPMDQMPTEATLASVNEELAQADMVMMSGKMDLAMRPSKVDLIPEVQVLEQDQIAAEELIGTVGTVSAGVWLVLENIVVKEAPAYTYNVYIYSKKAPEKRALVTRFSFFGFGDHGDHGAEGASGFGTRRYYLNDDIQEVGITDMEDIAVEFVPNSAVTGEPLDQDGESLISVDSVRVMAIPGSG
ncbi:MAG: tyrosinase family protein [Thermoanaerobaculia bacterium]|nr:tyrosinase family protein [Thermoanaerobaculia bacterium]